MYPTMCFLGAIRVCVGSGLFRGEAVELVTLQRAYRQGTSRATGLGSIKRFSLLQSVDPAYAKRLYSS